MSARSRASLLRQHERRGLHRRRWLHWLFAALHLAELGVSAVVLESGGPGFGHPDAMGAGAPWGSSGMPTSSLRGMVPSAVSASFPSWVQRQILSTM